MTSIAETARRMQWVFEPGMDWWSLDETGEPGLRMTKRSELTVDGERAILMRLLDAGCTISQWAKGFEAVNPSLGEVYLEDTYPDMLMAALEALPNG